MIEGNTATSIFGQPIFIPGLHILRGKIGSLEINVRAMQTSQLHIQQIIHLVRAFQQIAIEKTSFLIRMCVQINVGQHETFCVEISDERFDRCYRWVEHPVGCSVNTIEIAAPAIGSVMPTIYTIRVQHGDNFKNEMAA